MQPPLIEPLHQDQIAAACTIHEGHVPDWAASDRALDHLRLGMPGFSDEVTLIEAATVDRLYNTRHDNLVVAAAKVVEVMASPPPDPIALVDKIAPLAKSEDVTWTYVSFASKFVHFFVDPEATPIFDDWAVRGLRRHFGKLKWAGKTTFQAFSEYAQWLRELAGVTCSPRELDRYLWLSGMYRAWLGAKDKTKVALSKEVRRLSESSDPVVQHLLCRLVAQ